MKELDFVLEFNFSLYKFFSDEYMQFSPLDKINKIRIKKKKEEDFD